MATTTVSTPTEKRGFPDVRHMHWCPTMGRDGLRIEQHVAYVDTPDGKSTPTKRVTRCQDCGECHYGDL